MVYLEKIDPPEGERSRGRRGRWTYLPPPSGSAAELEGVALLNEISNVLGLLLFQRYRDVLLWNQTPIPQRRRLFDGRGDHLLIGGEKPALPPALAEPLGTLERMVRTGKGGEVVQACSAIASWGYDGGLLVTAAAYAHLAAIVSPTDPDLAFAAGRATRDGGHHSLAEVWFQRTISLGRRATNEEAKAAGYLGWTRSLPYGRRFQIWSALRGAVPAAPPALLLALPLSAVLAIQTCSARE